MNPLTDIQRGLIGLVIAVLVLGGAAWTIHSDGKESGAAEVQAKWDASERGHQLAETAARRKHDDDMAALSLKHLNINLKVSDDHEKELHTLRLERDADRSAVDRAGGLRIPAPACHHPVAATEAASAGGRDEASAATVRLPQQVENNLWALADDADEVSAQLRSCQAWIRNNGFYGPIPAETLSLLDRMIAEPNQPAEEPAP